MSFKEIEIIIKDEEKTYKEKIPVYQDFILSHDDEWLKEKVTSCSKNFAGDINRADILIKAKMDW